MADICGPVDEKSIDHLRKVERVLRVAREQWHLDAADALGAVVAFAADLGPLLGEISRDEAIDALKQLAIAKLEAMR